MAIFRRLDAIFIALHAECSARSFWRRNKHSGKQIKIIRLILTERKRYMSPVGDISTVKRNFRCIWYAEWYARFFQRRNRPNFKLNAPIYSILTKIVRAFAPDGDISTFKRYFHCILHAECSAGRFYRRNKHSSTQIVNIYSILPNSNRYFAPAGDISTFKRYLHCIFQAEYSADRFFRNKNSRSQILTVHSILTKTDRYFSPLEIFRRLNVMFARFYATNAMHACFIVETSTAARK